MVDQPAHQGIFGIHLDLESVLHGVPNRAGEALHGLDGAFHRAVALGVAHRRAFEDDLSHEGPAQGLQESHQCGLLVVLEDHPLVPETVDVSAYSTKDQGDFGVVHALVGDCVCEHAAGDFVMHDEYRGEASGCLAALILDSPTQEAVVE